MKVTVKDGFELKVNPSHTKLIWLALHEKAKSYKS